VIGVAQLAVGSVADDLTCCRAAVDARIWTSCRSPVLPLSRLRRWASRRLGFSAPEVARYALTFEHNVRLAAAAL